MKNIKGFKDFTNEAVVFRQNDRLSKAEDAGLYDTMSYLLDKANKLYCKFSGENSDDYVISSPDEAMELIELIGDSSEFYTEARELYNEIKYLNDQIDSIDAEEMYESTEPYQVDLTIQGEVYTIPVKKSDREKIFGDAQFKLEDLLEDNGLWNSEMGRSPCAIASDLKLKDVDNDKRLFDRIKSLGVQVDAVLGYLDIEIEKAVKKIK